MLKPQFNIMAVFLAAVFCLPPLDFAAAHHVLGRPAYSLNEDSNTPPGIQGEAQIGEYSVTYMIFPAFPRPDHPGRVNLYITNAEDGAPFQGKVAFKVRDASWYAWLGIGGAEKKLGLQSLDDSVFRQSFVFGGAGDYIISAEFQSDGEPYVIDLPLRVGEPAPVGPVGIGVGLLVAVLVTVSVIQRRRAMTGKIRAAQAEKNQRPG